MNIVYWTDPDFLPYYHLGRVKTEFKTAEFRSDNPACGFVIVDNGDVVGIAVSHLPTVIDNVEPSGNVEVPSWAFSKGYSRYGMSRIRELLYSRKNKTYVTYILKSKINVFRASLLSCKRLGFKSVDSNDYCHIMMFKN